MKTPDSILPEKLLEHTLARLGFSRRPEPGGDGLRAIYDSWCRRVPFDNVRKLIHVRTGHSEVLPGNTAEDFFEAWLKFGTGGTCWSGAGACQKLLQTLGFDAVRGVGTMLVAPNLPPNHGTVLVTLDDARYLVDCSILHGEPLLLHESAETCVDHPAWGVRCTRHEGRWHIAWRPLHKPDGFDCRLERFGAKHTEFVSFYGKTRLWSPFNYELSVRINRRDSVIGAGFGKAVTLHPDGSVSSQPVSMQERNRLLIEEIGISEEIVRFLPADTPTPPPPSPFTRSE
ncbi:MAG TPA: arylamine N-acetyltransferase [Chthoniobacterales bacterium]